MSKNRGNPEPRRGSALLMTLVFAMLIATVIVYMHSNTMNAATLSTLRETNDAAAAAADFAVETAVTNLSDMLLRPVNPSAPAGSPNEQIVDADWVRKNPFFAAASDQRRIGGTLDVGGRNMDYRVLVRSLRDARANNTMPPSWLNGVNDDAVDGGFVFGDTSKGKLRNYVGTYEITASVRPSSAAGIAPLNAPMRAPRAPSPATNTPAVDPRLNITASSKTLVTLRYQHPLNDQENMAVLNSDNIAVLNATPDLKVSGEDHYGLKSVVQNVIQELVIQDIVTIKGTDSQLFSVTNPSWAAGEQTLQFQMDPTGVTYNPHVPRTVDFSKNKIDREMISRNENAQQDKYVFGGKREANVDVTLPPMPGVTSQLRYSYGRSATFADDDTAQVSILETSFDEARPTGYSQMAFAIGKFESFNRLYLNYTVPVSQRLGSRAPEIPSHPEDDASSTEVQKWKNEWEQSPLTYWSKAQTQAAQYVSQVPLDNGQSAKRRHMAARFWIKNREGKFLVRDYNYSSSTPPANWDGYYTWSRYNGYYLNTKPGSGNYHLGYPDESGERIIHTRLLTLEELLGFVVTKGPDGLPAKLDGSGNIIGGTPAFVLDEDGEMIPYRLTVNGNETQFDEAAQRVNSVDNYGIKTSNIDDSRYPPRDGIYVRERDSKGKYIIDAVTKQPKVTVYRTMEDFAYELDLAPAGAEEPDVRELVTIHMVIEQTPETHPSNENMYFDMGACITVVFPKIIEEELKVNIFEGMDKYWWEGIAQETLTDRMSHDAITGAPPKDVLDAETAEDKLQAMYDHAFGSLPGDAANGIFTMVGDDGEKIMFKKAVLVTGETDPAIGTLLNMDEDQPNLFYYTTRDDLYRVLAGMLEQGLTTNEVLNNAPVLTDVSLGYIRRLPANSGAQFRMVGERYATDTGYREAFVTGTHPSALTVSDKYVSSRNFAGEVFGTLTQQANAIYVKRTDGGALQSMTSHDPGFEGMSPGDDHTTAKLPFLPSERLITSADPVNQGYDIVDRSKFVPIINQNYNTLQYNGQPLTPVIITDEEFNRPPTASNNVIYQTPSWIDKHELLMGYGVREEISRSGIGWHRSGPRFEEPLMQDHYVYAIAGQPGFMPFVTEDSTGRVALIRDQSFGMTDDEIEAIEFKPRLKRPEDMPTFKVVGEPLDGAGILVINGNLEISTEFAYHGTLVVMGDLIMKPAKMSLPKRNENGLIVDAAGNVLLNDWKGYYFTRQGARVDSEPEMVDQWASSLVMQGQLFLGGGIKNIEVDGHKGRIDIRGSSGALEDTTGQMFDGKEKRGIFRLLHSDVDSGKEVEELWNPGL